MATSKSEKAIETAAESGDAQAMYDFGLILENRGDLQGSGQWMARASESGMAKATFHVARFLFENGREAMSEEWFKKAVAQGSQEALDYRRNSGANAKDAGEVGQNFCTGCGAKNEGGKFCPSCGNALTVASEESSYGELSFDQRQVVQCFVADLSEVVTTYGISPVSYEEDELEQDDLDNNRVWSIVEFFASGNTNQEGIEDDAYRTDAMLSPGFEEGALEYHVSKFAYSEDQPLASNPYTSLFLNCSACDAEGCEVCDGEGYMVYGAVWDDNGVSFSRE